MSHQRKLHWPDDWKTEPRPTQLQEADIKRLAQWMKAMAEWGRHLRDDLLRLEGAAGFVLGDPGDPPPEPWPENDD